MHSDGFKGMENRTSKWKTKHVCVFVCNSMCRETNYISKLYFKWGTSKHCPSPIWLLWKWEQTLAKCMRVSTCVDKHARTHTHTCKHKYVFVYSNSSVHSGGLHEWLHKVFSRWWQLLCLAGEDVTKILILDKQIATDSLTGQNLQVNRIKNSSIDSNKQIATNWLTRAQPVSKQNGTTQIGNGGAISQQFVMCRFRFAD